MNKTSIKLTAAILVLAIIFAAFWLPTNTSQAATNNSPNANAGTTGTGGASATGGATTGITRLARFIVNPLTKSVTARLLQ